MVVMSGSRTGIISILILLVLNTKNLETLFKKVIPLFFVIGVFLSPFLMNVLSRFSLENIFFTRITHWTIAFESIKEKYLLGLWV